MQRYVILLKFTDSGMREIADSPARAKQFCATAEKVGAKVESVFWTLGEFDGVLLLQAPDEATAVALVLSLHKADKVHTRMLRAFEADQFTEILQKLPS